MKKFDKFIDIFINKTENILSKVFNCKYLYYILALIVFSVIYYNDFKNQLTGLNLSNNPYSKYYLIGFSIILVITILLIIFNNVFKKMKIHFKYLIIALLLGFAYLFVSPSFTQSDESFHFIRAYQVSMGHFVSPTNENGNGIDTFPESLFKTLWDDDDQFPEYKNYEDIFKLSKIKLEPRVVVTTDVRASNYIFLNYLPHAIGIKIGSLLNLSPYIIGVLGRITNLLFCIGLISLAIAIIPICKKSLSIFLLAPSILAYFASMSADGVIIATSFLLISLVINYIYTKKKLNIKNYMLLLLLVLFVSTCKVAYLPIIGIIILLPKDCFKDTKHKLLYCGSLIVLGITFSLIWFSLGNIVIEGAVTETGIAKYIRFITLFFNTFMIQGMGFIQNIFAGDYMYQRQVQPHAIIPFAYLITLIISLLQEDKGLKMRYINKVCVSTIGLLVILLVSYSMFGANTPAGYTFINGIQGRYFVPICLLYPFFIKESNRKNNINNLLDISLLLNFCVLLNMLIVFTV